MSIKKNHSLSTLHLFLALGIALVWGVNFVMIKMGLEELSPLTLCTVRFFFASFPAIFFIKKPNAPWKLIILYGLFIFALQFSLLFIGMQQGVSAGLAAILLQLQVFFAIFFAYLFTKQKSTSWQIAGAIVAFSGILIVGFNMQNGECSVLGFLLILSAAISWGIGNVISVKMHNVNMLSLVIWGSLIAFIPLLFVTLIFEPPQNIMSTLQNLSWQGLFSIAYITYGATIFGYGGWSFLVSKYPMASIAPFALLAPIIAMISSSLFLNESFQLWKISAAFLVIAGLCLNLFGARMVSWFNFYLTRQPRST